MIRKTAIYDQVTGEMFFNGKWYEPNSFELAQAVFEYAVKFNEYQERQRDEKRDEMPKVQK